MPNFQFVWAPWANPYPSTYPEVTSHTHCWVSYQCTTAVNTFPRDMPKAVQNLLKLIQASTSLVQSSLFITSSTHRLSTRDNTFWLNTFSCYINWIGSIFHLTVMHFIDLIIYPFKAVFCFHERSNTGSKVDALKHLQNMLLQVSPTHK